MSRPIEIHELSASYGSKKVLESISLRVNQGELIGLIGPNGAGKTTLIRCILGLIRHDTGSISVDGCTGRAAAKKVGYVPQRHEFAWDYPLSCENVVLTGLSSHLGLWKRMKQHHWQSVYRALRLVHMEDMRQTTIGKLSGGQRQRILIARALASDPTVLILDEPFTGLDQPTIDMLCDVFRELQSHDVTIMMSTHDIVGALDICDRVVMLNKTIRAIGTPQQLCQPELWMSTYNVSRSSPLLRSVGCGAW